jgi:hypothetical protein
MPAGGEPGGVTPGPPRGWSPWWSRGGTGSVMQCQKTSRLPCAGGNRVGFFSVADAGTEQWPEETVGWRCPGRQDLRFEAWNL